MLFALPVISCAALFNGRRPWEESKPSRFRHLNIVSESDSGVAAAAQAPFDLNLSRQPYPLRRNPHERRCKVQTHAGVKRPGRKLRENQFGRISSQAHGRRFAMRCLYFSLMGGQAKPCVVNADRFVGL